MHECSNHIQHECIILQNALLGACNWFVTYKPLIVPQGNNYHDISLYIHICVSSIKCSINYAITDQNYGY